MADPLLANLDEEDSVPAPESIPVPEDDPAVEGPARFEQPPAPTAEVPGPEVQAARDAEVPPVPAEAPGNIGRPAPLPGAGPAAPPVTPVSAGAPDTMATAGKQADLDQKKAAIEQEKADREAKIAQEHEEDARLAYADYLERRKAAQDRLAEKVQKYEEQGRIVDPRQHTDMTKARLSVIFGGLGSAFRSAGGGDAGNHALSQLQQKWDDDLERQKANIGLLKDSVVMARAGVKDVDEGRAELEQAANAKTLAQYNAAIKQGERQLKALGFQQADIDADKRIQSLVAGRAALAAKAQKERDEHDLAQAKVAMYLRKAGKGKGTGGAGGGGGSDALAQFVEESGKLAPGDPIPPSLAVLGRRAGLKPNQIAAEVDRYRGSGARATTAAGKAANAGIMGERQLSKEAESWSKANGIPALIKKQDELAAVLEEVRNAPHNPLQQALAVEKAVSSARGGAASKQALALALHHLGGKWDSIEALIQGARDGELGQKQMDNFIGFMTNQLGTAQGEGAKKYEAFNKYLESQPPEKRTALEGQRGRIFSGVHGFGGEEGPAPTRAAKVVPADAKLQLAKDILAGKVKSTEVQRRNARDYVKANGG